MYYIYYVYKMFRLILYLAMRKKKTIKYWLL